MSLAKQRTIESTLEKGKYQQEIKRDRNSEGSAESSLAGEGGGKVVLSRGRWEVNYLYYLGGRGWGRSVTFPSWGEVNDLSFLGEEEVMSTPLWPCDLSHDAFGVTSPPTWTDRCLWKHNLRSLRNSGGKNGVISYLNFCPVGSTAVKLKRTFLTGNLNRGPPGELCLLYIAACHCIKLWHGLWFMHRWSGRVRWPRSPCVMVG